MKRWTFLRPSDLFAKWMNRGGVIDDILFVLCMEEASTKNWNTICNKDASSAIGAFPIDKPSVLILEEVYITDERKQRCTLNTITNFSVGHLKFDIMSTQSLLIHIHCVKLLLSMGSWTKVCFSCALIFSLSLFFFSFAHICCYLLLFACPCRASSCRSEHLWRVCALLEPTRKMSLSIKYRR